MFGGWAAALKDIVLHRLGYVVKLLICVVFVKADAFCKTNLQKLPRGMGVMCAEESEERTVFLPVLRCHVPPSGIPQLAPLLRRGLLAVSLQPASER